MLTVTWVHNTTTFIISTISTITALGLNAVIVNDDRCRSRWKGEERTF